MQIQDPVATLVAKATSSQANLNSEPEPNNPGSPSNADVSRIASILQDEAPPVQEHAVRQHREESQQRAQINQQRDAAGTIFNPDIHALGADGQPAKTTRGTWALKRGRKSGGQNVASGSTVAGAPSLQNPREVQARAAGESAAILLVTVCRTFGGEEWTPIHQPENAIDEYANLRKAFADYFQAKGLQDIPPGIALSIAVVGYAGPRLFMPQTKSKIEKLSLWTKAKLWGMRRRAPVAQQEPLPRERVAA